MMIKIELKLLIYKFINLEKKKVNFSKSSVYSTYFSRYLD